MPFSCPKCGAEFATNQKLARHLARTRPCDPILEHKPPGPERDIPNRCRFCGRTYSRPDSLKRHLKGCSIANSDEGMERLYVHALKKQQARFEDELAKRDAQIAAMAARLDLLAAGVGPQNVLNIGTVDARVVNMTNIITDVTVVSFDREGRIRVPVALVKAAFTENPRLVEYCRLSEDERVDADRAAPYVLEALVDLVRRAHRDPVYRNIYLNPKRADQVMVCVEGGREGAEGSSRQSWEIRSLVEAIRLLFDGVADNLHKIIVTDQSRTQLPLDVQSAASWVPNLYEGAPERFVTSGRAPMAAHLANTRSSFDITAVIVAK
jgi:hypothetical protein